MVRACRVRCDCVRLRQEDKNDRELQSLGDMDRHYLDRIGLAFEFAGVFFDILLLRLVA